MDEVRYASGVSIDLDSGAKVAVFPHMRGGGCGFRFTNPEGGELQFSLTPEATAALLYILNYELGEAA